MALATNLGFPRVGVDRELKKAQEAFWRGDKSAAELEQTAFTLRQRHWQLQHEAGIDHIPVNDFSLYDHVLDTIAMTGSIPPRYGFNQSGKKTDKQVDLNTYFAMARGRQAAGVDVVAMEMTKWFDTNYHYIVPEFYQDTHFSLASHKVIDQFIEAKKQGLAHPRPVLLGPVSFLLLGKSYSKDLNKLDLLADLLKVYQQVLSKLEAAGAEWVQIDEPCLVLDLDAEIQQAYKTAYQQLAAHLAKNKKLKLLLTTYFGDLGNNLELALSLPVAGVHLDLIRAPQQLDQVTNEITADKYLSMGVIDGRNVWKTDFNHALVLINKALDKISSDHLFIAPSCSLLHSPVDLDQETSLDSRIKNWLAFAKQKLAEIKLLTDAANGDINQVAFAENQTAMRAKSTSELIHNPDVKSAVAKVDEPMLQRKQPYALRAKLQRASLQLPILPTTTIGSFPQTKDVRQARARFKKGELNAAEYQQFLQEKTKETIEIQEELDIDMLVHGEFERNDMVEYFGEQLDGFIFTRNGWVQSYGSRCVKPPIIFGDVARPKPMTVAWSSYAQSLTKRLVKGMLTGPITILQWSFVRNDQPRSETCRQIALAIRQEVIDLETAGIKAIQIDEPAIREGLPLRKADWADYLSWAVDAFRLSAAGVKDETQIHTHMCYSEFNDIIQAISDLDADVISIETSRSAMELLDAFVEFQYPNDIGPGVYDIHSPRVPKTEEMVHLLEKALKVIKAEQVWVNPDCGLKTRDWPEVKEALGQMVAATKQLRQKMSA